MKKPDLTASIRAAGPSVIRGRVSAPKLPVILWLAARMPPVKIAVCLGRSFVRPSWGARCNSWLARFCRSNDPGHRNWKGVKLSVPLFVRPCRRVIPVRGFDQLKRSRRVTIHFAPIP